MKEKRTTVNIRWVRFANNLLEGMNHTDAYIEAGYKPKNRLCAKAAAGKLLTNINFQKLLESKMDELERANRLRLKLEAKKAIDTLVNIRESGLPGAPTAKLIASKDLLDRAGYKPVDKTQNDHNVKGEIVFISRIPRPVETQDDNNQD